MSKTYRYPDVCRPRPLVRSASLTSSRACRPVAARLLVPGMVVLVDLRLTSEKRRPAVVLMADHRQLSVVPLTTCFAPATLRLVDWASVSGLSKPCALMNRVDVLARTAVVRTLSPVTATDLASARKIAARWGVQQAA